MLIFRVNRSSGGCGIGIAEAQMRSCECRVSPHERRSSMQSIVRGQWLTLTFLRYVVDAADVSITFFFTDLEVPRQADA